MRYSLASVATILLASTALAAPAVEKRDKGVYTEIVTKTVTEIVYEPTSTPCTTTTAKINKNKPHSTYAPPAPVYTTVTYDAPEDKPKPKPTTPQEYKPKPKPTTPQEYKPKPKPTDSQPAPGSSAPDDFARSCLDTHNEFRAKHNAPPLSWDGTMADYATQHTRDCVFEHSNSEYGENLAAGYDDPAAAISAWYHEGDNYDFSHPDYDPSSGHFTQVVWRDAKKLGCGFTKCNGSNGTPGTYISCNYDTGNVIGNFQDNVQP